MSNSKIAICLFNETIADFNYQDVLVGSRLEKVEFTGQSEYEVTVYQRKSEAIKPKWVDIVQKFGSLDTASLQSSSCGAILFVKIDGRIMGCCFGTSVANINRNNIETDFGLGVVYQKMVNSQTKSIESYSLAHNPITNNRTSTIPAPRSSFGLDQYLESITQLSGYFNGKKARQLIRGKEFYSISSPLTLKEIIELCKDCLTEYKKAIKNDDFVRLTSTRKVKDKKVIEELDKELCNSVKNRSTDVYIVDYDFQDDIVGYRLTPKGNIHTELNSQTFYENLNSDKVITIAFLKNKKIFPANEDEENVFTWSLYRCLFLELSIGPNFFILFKGKWYEIDENYLSALRNYVKEFEIDIGFLDEWNGTDREDVFNEKCADQLPNGQCWDKKLYTTRLYNYGIEFCDILSDNYIFHVKKYEGSQLTSHLLMQTTVSAQLLSSDYGIREWIKEISSKKFSGKNLLFNRKNEFKKDKQTYCILLMSRRTGKLHEILPFFTMITLHLTIKRITQLGFDVKVGKI